MKFFARYFAFTAPSNLTTAIERKRLADHAWPDRRRCRRPPRSHSRLTRTCYRLPQEAPERMFRSFFFACVSMPRARAGRLQIKSSIDIPINS